MGQVYASAQKKVFVSCWHGGADEDVAMWKTYADKGIAIRSTIGQLAAAIRHGIARGFDVYLTQFQLSPVVYEDLTQHSFERMSLWNFSSRKRSNFSYEKEVRAGLFHETWVHDDSIGTGEVTDFDSADHPIGFNVEVKLADVINDVYVSPTSGSRIVRLVESLVSKYELNRPVVHSSLLGMPSWVKHQRVTQA
jgi:hypothetical protein